MAGIDPLTLAAIGAATGAVGAGLTKGDPLQGAIMGGAMGGLGGAIGGAGGAAGLTGGSAGSVGAATAFPVAAQAAIPAQALTAAGASAPFAQALPVAAQAATQAAPLLPQSAPWAAPHLMTPQINPATAVGSGIFDTPEIAAYVSDQLATPSTSFFETMKQGLDPKILAQAQGMMPNQGKQPQMQAPSIRKGQAPQISAPMLALLEEQKKARPQRRRLSLV